MALPITIGCDAACIRTRDCSNASCTEMQWLRSLRHLGAMTYIHTYGRTVGRSVGRWVSEWVSAFTKIDIVSQHLFLNMGQFLWNWCFFSSQRAAVDTNRVVYHVLILSQMQSVLLFSAQGRALLLEHKHMTHKPSMSFLSIKDKWSICLTSMKTQEVMFCNRPCHVNMFSPYFLSLLHSLPPSFLLHLFA